MPDNELILKIKAQVDAAGVAGQLGSESIAEMRKVIDAANGINGGEAFDPAAIAEQFRKVFSTLGADFRNAMEGGFSHIDAQPLQNALLEVARMFSDEIAVGAADAARSMSGSLGEASHKEGGAGLARRVKERAVDVERTGARTPRAGLIADLRSENFAGPFTGTNAALAENLANQRRLNQGILGAGPRAKPRAAGLSGGAMAAIRESLAGGAGGGGAGPPGGSAAAGDEYDPNDPTAFFHANRRRRNAAIAAEKEEAPEATGGEYDPVEELEKHRAARAKAERTSGYDIDDPESLGSVLGATQNRADLARGLVVPRSQQGEAQARDIIETPTLVKQLGGELAAKTTAKGLVKAEANQQLGIEDKPAAGTVEAFKASTAKFHEIAAEGSPLAEAMAENRLANEKSAAAIQAQYEALGGTPKTTSAPPLTDAQRLDARTAAALGTAAGAPSSSVDAQISNTNALEQLNRELAEAKANLAAGEDEGALRAARGRGHTEMGSGGRLVPGGNGAIGTFGSALGGYRRGQGAAHVGGIAGLPGAVAGGALFNVGFAIQNGLMTAFQSATQLNKQLLDLKATTDIIGQGNQFGALRDNILSVADATGVAGTDVATLAAQFLGLYQNVNLANVATQSAAEFLAVSGAAAATAAPQLATFAATFGVSVTQAGNAAVASSAQSGRSKADTLTAISDVAPIAQAAGLSANQTVGLVTGALQGTALSAGDVSGGLNRIIPALQNDMSKLAHDGIKFDAKAMAGNIPEAIQNLIASMANGAPGVNMVQATQDLGGSQAARYVAALSSSQAAGDLGANYTDNNDLATSFATEQQSITASLGRLKQSASGLAEGLLSGGIGTALKDIDSVGTETFAMVETGVHVFADFNNALGGIPEKLAEVALAWGLLNRVGVFTSGTRLLTAVGTLGSGAGRGAAGTGTRSLIGRLGGGFASLTADPSTRAAAKAEAEAAEAAEAEKKKIAELQTQIDKLVVALGGSVDAQKTEVKQGLLVVESLETQRLKAVELTQANIDLAASEKGVGAAGETEGGGIAAGAAAGEAGAGANAAETATANGGFFKNLLGRGSGSAASAAESAAVPAAESAAVPAAEEAATGLATAMAGVSAALPILGVAAIGAAVGIHMLDSAASDKNKQFVANTVAALSTATPAQLATIIGGGTVNVGGRTVGGLRGDGSTGGQASRTLPRENQQGTEARTAAIDAALAHNMAFGTNIAGLNPTTMTNSDIASLVNHQVGTAAQQKALTTAQTNFGATPDAKTYAALVAAAKPLVTFNSPGAVDIQDDRIAAKRTAYLNSIRDQAGDTFSSAGDVTSAYQSGQLSYAGAQSAFKGILGDDPQGDATQRQQYLVDSAALRDFNSSVEASAAAVNLSTAQYLNGADAAGLLAQTLKDAANSPDLSKTALLALGGQVAQQTQASNDLGISEMTNPAAIAAALLTTTGTAQGVSGATAQSINAADAPGSPEFANVAAVTAKNAAITAWNANVDAQNKQAQIGANAQHHAGEVPQHFNRIPLEALPNGTSTDSDQEQAAKATQLVTVTTALTGQSVANAKLQHATAQTLNEIQSAADITVLANLQAAYNVGDAGVKALLTPQIIAAQTQSANDQVTASQNMLAQNQALTQMTQAGQTFTPLLSDITGVTGATQAITNAKAKGGLGMSVAQLAALIAAGGADSDEIARYGTLTTAGVQQTTDVNALAVQGSTNVTNLASAKGQDVTASQDAINTTKLQIAQLAAQNATAANSAQMAQLQGTLATEIVAGTDAQTALVQATLAGQASVQAALGDAVGAAQTNVTAAAAQLQADIAKNENASNSSKYVSDSAKLRAAKAAAISAQAQTASTLVSEEVGNNQMSIAQGINLLKESMNKYIAEGDLYDAEGIRTQIQNLINQGNQNASFNLPANIAIPTLYEVRRTEATPTGSTYNDNKQVNVSINIGNGVDTQSAVNALLQAVGGPATSGLNAPTP